MSKNIKTIEDKYRQFNVRIVKDFDGTYSVSWCTNDSCYSSATNLTLNAVEGMLKERFPE